jgi:hypothetical protein
MSEPLLHDFWMNALLEHQGRSRMPQIMESDVGQTRAPQYCFEFSIENSVIQRCADGGWEDEVVVLPTFLRKEFLVTLYYSMRAKLLHYAGAQ